MNQKEPVLRKILCEDIRWGISNIKYAHIYLKYTTKWREFMTEKKGTITISVPNETTTKQIKEIREQFKQSEDAKNYRLNIIISGTADPIENLGAFLKAWKNK